jgi:hypothetical protein
MGVLYLLFESASGYALLERTAAEEIAPRAEDVTDLKKFGAIVKLKGAWRRHAEIAPISLQNGGRSRRSLCSAAFCSTFVYSTPFCAPSFPSFRERRGGFGEHQCHL